MRTFNVKSRRSSIGLTGTVLACGAVLAILASAYPARADGPQRFVAVTQFNSNVPELPGQYVRDMLAGALMKSGVFSVSPQYGGGTEFIFDGVVTEVQPGKNKPGFVDILKEMGQSVQASINLDVRVTDARTGQWVESIIVNSRELKSNTLTLGDIAGLLEKKPPGNQPPDMTTAVKARQDSLNQALGACVAEAAHRIASKYGQPRPQAPGMSPNDPGFPPTQMPPSAPYPSAPNQFGVPPNFSGGPGSPQPGFVPGQPVPPGMSPPTYPGNQPPPGYNQPPMGGYRGVEERGVEESEKKESGGEGAKDK